MHTHTNNNKQPIHIHRHTDKPMQLKRCNFGDASITHYPLQPRFLISVLFVLKRCNHRDAIMVCFKEMQPTRCNRRDAAILFCKELALMLALQMQMSPTSRQSAEKQLYIGESPAERERNTKIAGPIHNTVEILRHEPTKNKIGTKNVHQSMG